MTCFDRYIRLSSGRTQLLIVFMFTPYISSNKKNPFVIIPTDAHYKNHKILKQYKIITLARTCFGSHQNHHQGAVLCLAKNYKARPHNRLICRYKLDCVYTDEQRKIIRCSF